MSVSDVLASRATFAVECARAEDFAARLPDGCASMLWCDIPYHRAIDAAWDNQWATDAAFLAWVGGLCEGWRRILAPNGSIYVFASPAMAWAVEGVARAHFEVLTNIRWVKPAHSTKAEMFVKEDLRSPFPASETILFCEQRGFRYEPIRAYLDGEMLASGMSIATVRDAIGFTGQMPYHWFARGMPDGTCKQWQFPTGEHYRALQAIVSGFFERPYEALRAEYEALRRPFQATPERPYTDVWTYPTVPHYDGKHPCEKPYPMCEDAVLLSTRLGDLVVDLFCGAGGIGSAAVANGRRFIGSDMDEHWADFTRRRCEMTKATGQTTVRKVVRAVPAQPSLFDAPTRREEAQAAE